MSSKPKIIMPSEAEEAEINRGIAADPDTFVPSDAQFAQMKRRGGRPNGGYSLFTDPTALGHESPPPANPKTL
jgi:hypothetical protein